MGYSELGCPQFLFNRDNGLGRGTRDWKQVSAISEHMLDTWSGYVAYAYDGPTGFSMTDGGPWNGIETLEFNDDMENFLEELEATSLKPLQLGWQGFGSKGPTCWQTEKYIEKWCNLNLLPVEDCHLTTPTRRASSFRNRFSPH